jgi:hypothetical protein
MREVQLFPPETQNPYEVVRWLQYFANGNELAAGCGKEVFDKVGRIGRTTSVCAYALASTYAREIFPIDPWYCQFLRQTPVPEKSPDDAFLALGFHGEGEGGSVEFVDFAKPEEGVLLGRRLQSCAHGVGALVFTPDGKELLGVQNLEKSGKFTPDVMGFKMAVLYSPPRGWEEKRNPLTGQSYQFPIYDMRWRSRMSLPPGERIVAAAISANGRLLAVGGEKGGIHIADLKKKAMMASFPWEGRAVRDRAAMRIAFDPSAKWVLMLANGRLFARTLNGGNTWRTKSTLDYAHDFAFHPSGNIICAVFADGHTRYLDARTGAVKQSFRWSKKPQPLYSVAFAPDGLTCAAGGENGQVVIWDVDL